MINGKRAVRSLKGRGGVQWLSRTVLQGFTVYVKWSFSTNKKKITLSFQKIISKYNKPGKSLYMKML